MKIFSVYIINKSGSLIYSVDDLEPITDQITSVTRSVHDSSCEIPLSFQMIDERIIVDFGEWGAGIEPGTSITEYNDKPVLKARCENRNIFELVQGHQKKELSKEDYYSVP